MMKKSILFLFLMTLLSVEVSAQRITQKLGRGVVAVNRLSTKSPGNMRFNRGTYLISWRRFAEEPDTTLYRVYINGSKITETKNTNYVPSALSDGDVITVNPVIGSEEQADAGGSFTYNSSKTLFPNAFMNIDFENKICPADSFRTPFVFPGDLDGDGNMDYVVVRVTNSSKYNTMAQAYNSDGTFLWTYDFGPNIDPVAGQNSLITVYDINLDGKAECIVKSSDGSRFWNKSANTWGLYAKSSATGDTDNDGIIDYTAQSKRNPPFYMSVINGETGAEMNVCELNYAEAHDGVDQYSRDNRSAYMDDSNGKEYAFMTGHIIVTYDDGIHPMIMAECLDRTDDGNHHNYVFGFTYDWQGNVASNWHHNFTWSRNDKTPWPAEGHQLRGADMDGDGRDEMLQIGYAANTSGMIMSAGIQHGDRYRVSDLDPTRPGMEVYAIQQSNLLGQVVYDAATGEHIKEWYLPSVYDVARGECMDVDSTHLGYEIYSMIPNLYDIKGNVVRTGDNPYPYEGIWWDGDFGREKLSSPGGSGYSSNAMIEKDYGGRLAEFSQESNWATHAEWAVRAGFWGDIIGDWREEVILMKQDNDHGATGIVGYSTDMPSAYSMYTLLQDPHYLEDCTSRGYYQSPNTSFYLGYAMKCPPLPGTVTADLRWNKGTEWNTSAANFKSFDLATSSVFQNGKSVMFDLSGDTTEVISLNTVVEPGKTYLMTPSGHGYTITGKGSIGGKGEIWKSERGKVTLNANISSTGKTIVSNGVLEVNGIIAGPVSLRALGTLGGKATINGDVDFEGSLNYAGCRLMPREVMTFGKSLVINNNVYDEVTLQNGTVDKIFVNGNLDVKDTLIFSINAASMVNKEIAGTYTLVEATGTIHAADGLLKVRNLEGQPYTVSVEGNKIVLTIAETRDQADGVVWTGAVSDIWDYSAENFDNAGAATYFVKDDKVIFNDEALNYDITLNGKMVQDSITFDNTKTYTLNGSGAISGNGTLVKNGPGEVIMNIKNNDYTGKTIINKGTLTITDLANAGTASSLGAATSAIEINDGTLKVNADNVSTNRGIAITDTATIQVLQSAGSVSLNGRVYGSGVLVKEGLGQLNLNYAGTNSIKALVMKKGTLAQGTKETTLGTIPVTAAVGSKSAINLIENKEMTNAPCYNHPTTIEENADLTIGGIYRGSTRGSFTGTGNLTLNTGGIRFDVCSDFSKFEGSLHIANTAGGWTRLGNESSDMKRLTLKLGDGVQMAFYKFGNSSTVNGTLQVGALENEENFSAFANAPVFGQSGQTWEIGYNNKDTQYSGKFTGVIRKVGTGTLMLAGGGSDASFLVKGGILAYRNFVSGDKLTTGTITVSDSGMVLGYGYTSTVAANAGGTVSSGVSMNQTGTMRTTGNLLMNSGSTLLVKASGSSNDKFQVSGTLCRMTNATIKIMPLNDRTFAVGDQLIIFSGTKPESGWNIVSTDGSTWDDSKLSSEGVLVCTGATGTDGINGVPVSSETSVDVYSADGRLIREKVVYGKALKGLQRGVYVINGKKVYKR